LSGDLSDEACNGTRTAAAEIREVGPVRRSLFPMS
jgi:hypothetical protein